MSDVPTNGANNIQTSSQSVGGGTGTHSRDIEDIDRELEAYLEEKRSGKSVGYHHSVDEQLSQIREKFGARVNSTREPEKPRGVEVAQSFPDTDRANKENQSEEQAIPKKQEVGDSSNKTPALSHEELIRSLEEKYSRGESTNLPPKVPASPKIESQPSKEKEVSTPAKEMNPLLLDLKESIKPINISRVEALLHKASSLSADEQKSLSETFLARFKRNMERMELYTRTQNELEDELERFISDATSASRSPEVEGVEKPVSPVAPPQQKQDEGQLGQKMGNAEVDTAPQVKETPSVTEGTSSVERRYRDYLSRLEKKPLVLVYEPENGFVRKPVDPSDSSLTLTYSLESSTNTAVLTVYDTHGNELGVFRTPEKELDN